MPDSNPTRDYGDVDEDPESAEFVDAMETVAGEEAIRAYKRQSHDLLHPTTGDRILDAGCGPGDDVLMLASHVGPDGEAIGVDNSEEMIRAARASADDEASARFEVDDVVDLSFDTDSFDAARADRVLQHLESPADGLAELKRVTKPGGRVGVTDSDFGSIVIDTPTGHTERFLTLDHAQSRNPTTGRQLYRLAKQAGLIDLDLAPVTVPVTELELFAKGMMLEDHTDAMVEAGEVAATEANEWLEGLRQADEQGLLFHGTTMFTVVGTVPGPN